MNPFAYRPRNPEDIDWENNWLSNSMAWVSDRMLPSLCNTADHWSSRMANYVWTDCPCCLVLRGMTLGAGAGLVVGILVGIII